MAALHGGADMDPGWAGRVTLEFCPYLLPEFVFTGHEITRGGVEGATFDSLVAAGFYEE